MSNPLEKLWKDRMDIYRWGSSVVNGVTKSGKQLKYSNIKCHYSKGSLGETGEGGVPTISSTHSLFCGVGTDIIEGDEVIVTQQNGVKIKLTVGECFPYSKQLEFKVKRSDTV